MTWVCKKQRPKSAGRVPLLVLAVWLLAAIVPLRADMIYTNLGFGSNIGPAVLGSSQSTGVFATAAPGTIHSIGYYFLLLPGVSSWDFAVDYSFSAWNAGAPGAELASGSGLNLSISQTGTAWLLSFDLQRDLEVSANVPYWLELSPGGFLADAIPLATTSGVTGANSAFGSGNLPLFRPEFTFYLESDPANTNAAPTAPEPGTFLLAAMAILAAKKPLRHRSGPIR
jgi:hypothetical protein